jgi:hypothetical protein
MQRVNTVYLTIGVMFCVGTCAFGDSISVSGQVTTLGSPPPSVVLGQLESDTTAYLFLEQSNLTLTSSVTVGLSDANAGTTITANSQFISAVLPVGTANLSTYTLHTDPVGSPLTSESFTGTITVPLGFEILGVIVGPSNLIATDAQLGSPTTTYMNMTNSPSTWQFRGYAFTGGANACAPGDCDSLLLSTDLRSLTFTSNLSNIDELRIVEAPVAAPEPTSILLAGLGLACISYRCRKASKRRATATA